MLKILPYTVAFAAILPAVVAFGQTADLFPFVLPWDDASPGVANVSSLLDKPAGARGFVQAKDGHLFAGDRRIRFFGMNFTFAASFPSHDEAEKVAARLARFGINCVRFHHMDMRPAPRGIMAENMRDIDPGQIEKLDYFIAQLKKNGIYTDLNLHVSRRYPELPPRQGMDNLDHGLDNFFPAMVEMQRAYARQLRTHVNPYTGNAYTDEPAVAIVEINNENGLLHVWINGKFDDMPDPYAAELRALERLAEGEVPRPRDSAQGVGRA